ncbi:MAG: 3-oxoacyl-ACP reductase [Deltaproteobacteria bacterium]|jgi:3-oxoacyl-[acyl-carrier protein] reductase|nr:3-oxoacyl-ACP reductase [Deltaproteobacteria bacterium]
MTDLLLENENARKLVKTLGLPIPVPEKLARARGPYEERPLDEKIVLVCGVGGLQGTLAQILTRAGAYPLVVGSSDAALEPFVGPGEAWARAPRRVEPGEAPEGARVDAIVFDGTGLETPDDLHQLYAFIGPWVRRLNRSGRVVVVGRPAGDARKPVRAATRAGLEGFTRSLAKEIGGNGSTANSVFVQEGADGRLDALLRFLLSPRSAYISCQPFHVTKLAKGEAAPETHVLGGKVALVTGAARGIGEATAEILAAEGAHVVCLDRPADDGPCSKVAQRVGGSTLLVDITDVDAPERIAGELRERFGGVDIVVHNAGVTRDKTLARMTPEQWDMAVDINLGAVIRITDRLLSDDTLRPEGRVICLSSVSGIAGNRGQTNYSAGKAGIVGFVEALAPKVAKKGITVNAIAPGFIETRLTDAMPVAIREVARRMAAVGQGGKPEDVGQAITFLATPGAVGLTGETVRVCGGALVGA